MPKVLMFCVTAWLLLSAFATVKNLDGVIEALKKGSATELARYVDDTVEIGLPDKTGTYNKDQATSVLRDFFAANSVRLFEVKHKGDNEGKQFCVGVLHTQSGSYRTQLFMHTKGGRQVIRLISFHAQ